MSSWNLFDNADRPDPEKAPGWLTTPMLDSNDVHVIPIHDEQPHVQTDRCLCVPDISIRADDDVQYRLITHQAWDGRER